MLSHVVRQFVFLFAVAATLSSLFSVGALAFDPCADAGGEFRQSFDCASVIQKHNVCCWKRRDGARGILPKGCCTTHKAWAANDCEGLIYDICDTHHADL